MYECWCQSLAPEPHYNAIGKSYVSYPLCKAYPIRKECSDNQRIVCMQMQRHGTAGTWLGCCVYSRCKHYLHAFTIQ